MGRIDQAMNRANLDAGRGTGAEAPEPVPSPWRIEQKESAAPESGEELPGGGPAAGPSHGPALLVESGRPSRWAGFDPDARQRLVASESASPLLIEQFRILAAALHRAQAEHRLSSLIVTSASPGDGKSHVATNLALTFADSYKRRVLLIDADMRRPTLHHIFRVSNAHGLSDALNGKPIEKATTVSVGDNLTLLPAGRAEASPLGLLSSDGMKRLVAEAVSRFDWVLIDSPPVGMLADARLVSECVDAAILVIRAGVTHFPDVQAAADKLGHDRVLGVVLNGADPAEIRGKGYYSYYYGSGRPKP
jgi:capsular exopolysaccharide synthesis family protein